ncbi:META domain-containing protein [Pelagibius sp. Alg239-R121]|uniref:META domain-containing protein n=1 Tax=Pelagibius sp. Alg239-R121 TaxID=2993448 RepID=UPI0024A744F6|nr:META domain-containing protein [Pelagibius sp. Alg239-R121]
MRPPLTLAAAFWFALSATPAAAEDNALDDCWAQSDNRIELGHCLRGLKNSVDDELLETYVQALNAQAAIDDFVGQRRASRTIERAQKAFELYRDLDCHLQELQAGSGSGAGDFYQACWIDMTRERIANLQSLLPETNEGATPLGDWRVEQLEGGKVMERPPLNLMIESGEKISGHGGCNRFFGPLKLKPSGNNQGEIEIGPLGSTRKACGDMIDDQELRFLEALAQADHYSIEGGSLVLSGLDGRVVLRLSQEE